MDPLPAVGSAVPVVMAANQRPAATLPAVGSWVKLKVVGPQLVQVCLSCAWLGNARMSFCVCGWGMELGALGAKW